MNLQFPDVNSMPSPDVFIIELAEWKRARLEDFYPDGSQVILAVEVLSPSNRKPALQSKINIYTTHGIEAWLVDPRQQEVKVYWGKKGADGVFKEQIGLALEREISVPVCNISVAVSRGESAFSRVAGN